MKNGKQRKRWYMILTMIALFLFLGLELIPQEISAAFKDRNKIVIYLAGDSTVADYPKTMAPRAGWGEYFAKAFDDRVVVRNEAKSGRSSKSYISEGRLDKITKVLKAGDYLFIQFGHNDAKIKDPSRYTEPFTTYKEHLRHYIDRARAKGAFPVLVTPVERRHFSIDGKALPSHGDYPRAMKELGSEMDVPVIDLSAKSLEMYQSLGPEKTKKIILWLEAGVADYYPKGIQDNVHFQKEGARRISSLLVDEIREMKLEPLASHLR